jgi:hypothetical protein
MAVQPNDVSRQRRKINSRVADEGNVPGSNPSAIGIVLVIVAIVIGIGLVYLSTRVSASMLSVAMPHVSAPHR